MGEATDATCWWPAGTHRSYALFLLPLSAWVEVLNPALALSMTHPLTDLTSLLHSPWHVPHEGQPGWWALGLLDNWPG